MPPIPPPPPPTDGPLTLEELQLAARNRGLPLEAMRYDITPSGLHYLLVHFDIPDVDGSTWRLAVGGDVERPVELTLDDIRARPRRTIAVTIECAGNGRARLSPRPISQPWLVEAVSTAEWTGAPLSALLEEAGLGPDAVEVVFTGIDHGIEKGYEHDYARSLSVPDAMRSEVLLAYEMNGRPLEPQHGFPLRLVAPGWYGMMHVKWLRSIAAISSQFDGYQQRTAYWYRQSQDDPGEPVTRIRPRALMIPPGFPDFLTRHRVVEQGRVVVRGRAWSGVAPITRVELGVDGAWAAAELDREVGPFAWRSWSAGWDASVGDHELSCRATDGTGLCQPDDQPWNVQGMGNNQVQRVKVLVR
jgi:DMSO/TMAO reductase YedYZ molybdopterin-dependent catalytic subunit